MSSFLKRLGRRIHRFEKRVLRVPVLGVIIKATYDAAAGPIIMTSQIAQGRRVDRVLMGQLKTAVGDAKAVAPIAQTIVSVIPGIGSGISAALGAGLALAEGKPLDQVAEAAVSGAIPGGPVAVAAYHVASNGIKAAATGRKFDFADAAKEAVGGALTTLGLPAAATQALTAGVNAAGKIAHGEPLDKALTAGAIDALPVGEPARGALHEATDLSIALAHGQRVDRALLDRVHGVVELLPIEPEAKAQIQNAARTGTSLAEGHELGKTLGVALHGAVADTLIGHGAAGLPAHVTDALKTGLATGAAVVHQAHARQRAATQPGELEKAVRVLHAAATAKRGAHVDTHELATAKSVVGHALALGAVHPAAFIDHAAAVHKGLTWALNANTPRARSIAADLEEHMLTYIRAHVAELNALVHAYNAKQAPAVAKVAALHTQHEHGNVTATVYLDDLRRRTAALKKAHEFHVDARGYTRHAGAA